MAYKTSIRILLNWLHLQDAACSGTSSGHRQSIWRVSRSGTGLAKLILAFCGKHISTPLTVDNPAKLPAVFDRREIILLKVDTITSLFIYDLVQTNQGPLLDRRALANKQSGLLIPWLDHALYNRAVVRALNHPNKPRCAHVVSDHFGRGPQIT
eukprot:6195040-Pleurochrysis_carterae.AAC.1